MSGPIETATPLLAMKSVVKRFGGVQALRGVDFDLRREKFMRCLGTTGPASRR